MHTSPSDIKNLSLQQLEEMRIELRESLTAIRDQIDRANLAKKEQDIVADPEWYRNVNVASRMKGIQHQQVLQEMERRQSLEDRLSKYFVEVAKEELDLEDFNEMMDIAHERYDEFERMGH